MNQEPLEEVLSHYGIKATSIRNESYKEKKGVWWVETAEGLKILKKISNSEDTLKYILHAVEHLSGNGVLIPRVNKTTTGSSYVNIDGTCFVLSDAVKGKNPKYSSPKELEAIVKTLARFHKVSTGFSPLPGSKPKKHLGDWLPDYTSQVEEMNGFYQNKDFLAQQQGPGALISEVFPYFYERAMRAIEGLKGEEYKAWVDKVEKTGGLCHQDFAAGNLILESSGNMYVLDTDSITIDIPSRDIRKILNKIMKKNGEWDIDLAKKILSFYQQQNPLTPSEWKVVKYDLMFPHLFLGAMNKYCYKRDKEWTVEKYLKRMKEMDAMEKTINPVLENYDAMIEQIQG